MIYVNVKIVSDILSQQWILLFLEYFPNKLKVNNCQQKDTKYSNGNYNKFV